MSTARKLTRQEAKLLTRQRLIVAAQDLLRQQDYDAISVSEITRVAGVAQPTFYVHFRDKDDILEAAARAIGDDVRGTMRAAREQMLLRIHPSREGIREVLRIAMEALAQEPELMRLLYRELHGRDAPTARISRALYEELMTEVIQDIGTVLERFHLPAEPAGLRLKLDGLFMMALSFLLDRDEGRIDSIDPALELLVTYLEAVFPELGMLTRMNRGTAEG
ncbi:MAG: TetR/AcrR family transcriptional regulator [Candidatus Dadabacteria bacterium]|nr:MAG: TetR/AcrR family transcriptional regulator [Candidatus Dadabacteria bacterium]